MPAPSASTSDSATAWYEREDDVVDGELHRRAARRRAEVEHRPRRSPERRPRALERRVVAAGHDRQLARSAAAATLPETGASTNAAILCREEPASQPIGAGPTVLISTPPAPGRSAAPGARRRRAQGLAPRRRRDHRDDDVAARAPRRPGLAHASTPSSSASAACRLRRAVADRRPAARRRRGSGPSACPSGRGPRSRPRGPSTSARRCPCRGPRRSAQGSIERLDPRSRAARPSERSPPPAELERERLGAMSAQPSRPRREQPHRLGQVGVADVGVRADQLDLAQRHAAQVDRRAAARAGPPGRPGRRPAPLLRAPARGRARVPVTS